MCKSCEHSYLETIFSEALNNSTGDFFLATLVVFCGIFFVFQSGRCYPSLVFVDFPMPVATLSHEKQVRCQKLRMIVIFGVYGFRVFRVFRVPVYGFRVDGLGFMLLRF